MFGRVKYLYRIENRLWSDAYAVIISLQASIILFNLLFFIRAPVQYFFFALAMPMLAILIWRRFSASRITLSYALALAAMLCIQSIILVLTNA